MIDKFCSQGQHEKNQVENSSFYFWMWRFCIVENSFHGYVSL